MDDLEVAASPDREVPGIGINGSYYRREITSAGSADPSESGSRRISSLSWSFVAWAVVANSQTTHRLTINTHKRVKASFVP